jgi:tetratricopeptide (TPR) repeat protein
MKLTKLSLIISGLIVLSSCAKNEPSLSVLWQDMEARKQLQAERYEEALQSYYELVEKNPDLAGTHSNIGVILNFIQRPEDALKSLEHALTVAKENKDPAAEFAVHFNLGVYFGANKDVDQALEHYQAALEIVPSSIEAKTNIELLVQQQQKQQGEGGEQSQKDQQNQNGQSGDSQNQDNKNDRDNKDEKKDGADDKKKDDKDKGENEEEKKENEGKKRENSPKYKPRAFQGEELSEGDVKKILGELRNQEQKIRANFEKKEKGKTKRNEKDW